MDVWTCFHLNLVDTSGVGVWLGGESPESECVCVTEYDVVMNRTGPHNRPPDKINLKQQQSEWAQLQQGSVLISCSSRALLQDCEPCQFQVGGDL